MNAIAIMQGRLSPGSARTQAFPAHWQAEFDAARMIGFDAVEWLVTADSIPHNPLLSHPDLVARIAQEARISVTSVCADYFIEQPIAGISRALVDDRLVWLERLIESAAAIGANVVVVPLLESNAPADAAQLASVLTDIGPMAALATVRGLQLAVESDLPADQLAQGLRGSDVAVCYDVGNAAAAGFDAAAGLRMLGDRLALVHLKDRRVGGASVALGDGDVNFAQVFEALRLIGYDGPLTLETPRGDDPFAAARRHLEFVKRHAGAAAAA